MTLAHDLKSEIENRARRRGLDFNPIIVEEVNKDEVYEIAACGGYPVRYHSYRFGQESVKMKRLHRYAGNTIYELVIPTNPCYAYFWNALTIPEQKLVMAHVCGHADFFKNNVWFQDMPSDLHNRFADNAYTIERIRKEIGRDKVDKFLEACWSLENLFDFVAPLRKKSEAERSGGSTLDQEEPWSSEDLPEYMKTYIYPKEYQEKILSRRKLEKERLSKVKRGLILPERPTRDIWGFLLKHAPMEEWQREVARIVSEEALYLFRGGVTKIMNEGWATFWHCRLLFEDGIANDSELFSCLERHTSIMGPDHPRQFNPYQLAYQLGVRLWEHIEYRWNTGRHGRIWTECDEAVILDQWEEFVVFCTLVRQYGGCNEQFNKKWKEYSTFLNEMKRGNGPLPAVCFLNEHKVTEWLKYQESPEYEELRRRIKNGEARAPAIEIPNEWKEWSWKHDLEMPLGSGLEKIFEVRKTHNDVTFIQEFFTDDFCQKYGYYTVGIGKDEFGFYDKLHFVVKSKDYRRVKKVLLDYLINIGQPKVVLFDANYNNNGELRLVHLHDGRDLYANDIYEVLKRLYLIWNKNKPVSLETFKTEFPRVSDWLVSWRPKDRAPLPVLVPRRSWVRYTFDGRRCTKRVILWEHLEQEIKKILPIDKTSPLQ